MTRRNLCDGTSGLYRWIIISFKEITLANIYGIYRSRSTPLGSKVQKSYVFLYKPGDRLVLLKIIVNSSDSESRSREYFLNKNPMNILPNVNHTHYYMRTTI